MTTPRTPQLVAPTDAEREELVRELRRTADEDRAPSRARLERLVTEASAFALLLDRERLLAKRKARAALVLAQSDAAARADARRWTTLEGEREAQAGEIRELVQRLRRRFSARA